MKEKIKEIFVVEGKNDSAKLKSIYECSTIETGGSALKKETLKLIALALQKQGVIIFLDPDSAGEKLRQKINQAVPGCLNAFLLKEDCQTKKKVGVEHAGEEKIKEALKHLINFTKTKETLTYSDYFSLGLSGDKDASSKREILAKKFHLGKANAKTCFNRLNMLKKTKLDIIEALNE